MNTIHTSQQHDAVHANLFFPVKYHSFRNDPVFQRNFNVGRSLDISVDSLLLGVGKHNPVDSKLDMELELPNGLSAYVIGQVSECVDKLINGIMYHFDKITFSKLDKEAEDILTKQIGDYLKKKSTGKT